MADILCQMYFLAAILKILIFKRGSIAENMVLYMSDICVKAQTNSVKIDRFMTKIN